MRLFYRDQDGKYDIPPAIFARYTFGMVAAAVLLEGRFFLDAPRDNDVARDPGPHELQGDAAREGKLAGTSASLSFRTIAAAAMRATRVPMNRHPEQGTGNENR